MTQGGAEARAADPALVAEVSAVRPSGRHDAVTLWVPTGRDWPRARPGQLVVLPGDPGRGEVQPVPLWLAGVGHDPVHGTSIELHLAAGRAWPVGTPVRMLGPFGRGFALPTGGVSTLLVGHEREAVPLRWLAALLRDRDCPVHLLLSARTPEDHLDLSLLRRLATSVRLTTPDDLAQVVPTVLDDPGGCDPALVLATGPRPLVRTVARAAVRRGRVVRVSALDLSGATVVCGTGVCGVCSLTVPGPDGPRRLRACVDGPVVPGELLAEVPGAPR